MAAPCSPCIRLPPVQVPIIAYRIEPLLAERLAQWPGSPNRDPADPTQVHRFLTTLLDPQQAPAEELIRCDQERS